MKAKQKICDGKIDGVTMSEMSDAKWAQEFDAIHKTEEREERSPRKHKRKSLTFPKEEDREKEEGGENFISFGGFVTYTLKNIIKPAVYVANGGEGGEPQEHDGKRGKGNKQGKGGSEFSAFTRMMPRLIAGMDEKAQEEKALEISIRRIIKSMNDAPAADVQQEGKPGRYRKIHSTNGSVHE